MGLEFARNADGDLLGMRRMTVRRIRSVDGLILVSEHAVVSKNGGVYCDISLFKKSVFLQRIQCVIKMTSDFAYSQIKILNFVVA